MFKLRKVVEIDAAHDLPGHPGRCSHLHGHRWTFIVEVATEKLNEQEMVVDFGDIKRTLERLDHTYINSCVDFVPTAENLAQWATVEIARLVPDAVHVIVTVQETPGSAVSFEVPPPPLED